MAISLDEELLSLKDAAGTLPRGRGGRPVHVATLHRWSKVGLHGHQLETLKIGGSTVTSRQALQRFFDRLTAATSNTQSSPEPQSGQEDPETEKQLDNLGV